MVENRGERNGNYCRDKINRLLTQLLLYWYMYFKVETSTVRREEGRIVGREEGGSEEGW